MLWGPGIKFQPEEGVKRVTCPQHTGEMKRSVWWGFLTIFAPEGNARFSSRVAHCPRGFLWAGEE